VVTPYYNKPPQRGIVAHFEEVAHATDRPIVVYNIPSRCVVDISNDELARLAEIPNVSAVKQARYEDIQPIDGLDLLAGNDDTLAQVLDLGGTGGILVAWPPKFRSAWLPSPLAACRSTMGWPRPTERPSRFMAAI